MRMPAQVNHIVAVPLDIELAQLLGKKGSENSITFYNSSSDGHVITALMPTSIDEKPYAAAESLLMAHQVVLSTRSIDRLFGEMAVACGLLGKEVVLTDDNDVSGLLEKSGITSSSVVPRERAAEYIRAFQPNGVADGSVRVDVDKTFDVKGIGTVVLGIVTRGTVRVHDELFHGSGKRVLVRSIQSQDRDIAEAGPGTRVGLALKGIGSEEIEKGELLTGAEVKPTAALAGSIRVSDVGKEELAAGKSYGFVSGFTYSRATIAEAGSGSVSLKLEKQAQVERGDAFMLLRERAPRLFAAGHIK